jgi:hypothetical protein
VDPEGSEALAYLRDRCLTDESIRSARLGWHPRVEARTKDGRCYFASGIVVPWLDGDTPTMMKVRQPEGSRPKYAQVFHHRARHVGIYPGRHVIRPGRPLVVVEGEFDAILLGQVLGDLAPVATLGSASARPDPGILGAMLGAPTWYIATDADEAGDRAADGWPGRARRARPPMLRPHPDDHVEKAKTDWTDLHQHGFDLARWWRDRLGGIETSPLFTWDDLAAQRWGPAADDPTPGIIIDRPDRVRMLAALREAADDPDSFAIAERLAIQAESEG